MENPHQGHRKRLKQKFIDNGLYGFLDHEVLELLLCYSIPRQDTNEIAHLLLNHFGSFSNVFNADINSLQEVKGISEHSAVLIKMIQPIMGRYISEASNITEMDKIENVCRYFKGQFFNDRQERVRVACLDNSMKLISSHIVCEGAPDKVRIDVRKLIELTYKTNSSNIIIAHNHPEGDAIASQEDIATTHFLINLLENVGIKLIDHIIVGKDYAVSMRDSGVFIV